ncbi:hypothetical protein SE18_14725 [Herpetosiphon geysericola]|uniref:3-keto-disaccharide hydrolase domain-containing protein n=2 Tax=Herpetosiphon geysericola TaxID=70996 RepID=A0A0P6Y0T0_9CHLR|nr:hypothetical protein SE18_14725 [Herpetosiphon geysericola]
MKSMRSVLVIAVGLIVIVGALYVGFRNQNADEATDVPTGKPLDFSQHRCEEILYGRGYRTKIIAPDNEIESRPINQIRVPSSGPVGSILLFDYQGYNYEKACPDPLNVADTNIDQWQLVKGQLYENLHKMGIELFSDPITDELYTGFYLAERTHEPLFTLETKLVMQDKMDKDTNEHAAGLMFRVPALAIPERATGYGVALTTKGPDNQSGVKLFKYDPANTVIQFVPFEVSTERLYQLKVAVSPAPDPRIKVWVDDRLLIDVADPEPNIVGYAGVMVSNEVAHFDHMYLHNQGSPLAASALNTNLPAPWVKLPLSDSWLEAGDSLRGSGQDDSFYISDSKTANGQLSADIRFDDQPATAALLFRVKDKIAPTNGSYAVGISTENGGELKLFKFPYQPIKIVKTSILPDLPYTLQIEFIGPYLKVLLNGQMLIDYTMDSTYIEGFVGLNVYRSTASLQNIQLTQPQLIENFATNLAEPWQVSDLLWPVNALTAQKIKRGLLVSAIGFYLSNTETPNEFMFESDIMLVADPALEQATAGLVMFHRYNASNRSLIAYMSTNNGGELSLFEYPDGKGGSPRYSNAPLARCKLPIYKDVVYKLNVSYKDADQITILLDGQACINHPLTASYSGGYFGLAMHEGNALFNNTVVLTPLN